MHVKNGIIFILFASMHSVSALEYELHNLADILRGLATDLSAQPEQLLTESPIKKPIKSATPSNYWNENIANKRLWAQVSKGYTFERPLSGDYKQFDRSDASASWYWIEMDKAQTPKTVDGGTSKRSKTICQQ